MILFEQHGIGGTDRVAQVGRRRQHGHAVVEAASVEIVVVVAAAAHVQGRDATVVGRAGGVHDFLDVARHGSGQFRVSAIAADRLPSFLVQGVQLVQRRRALAADFFLFVAAIVSSGTQQVDFAHHFLESAGSRGRFAIARTSTDFFLGNHGDSMKGEVAAGRGRRIVHGGSQVGGISSRQKIQAWGFLSSRSRRIGRF